jgi:hypothetical protein
MGQDVNAFRYTLNDPVLGSGTRTCGEWTEVDRETLHPVQFFPRYMRCLIAYGQERGRTGGWQ